MGIGDKIALFSLNLIKVDELPAEDIICPGHSALPQILSVTSENVPLTTSLNCLHHPTLPKNANLVTKVAALHLYRIRNAVVHFIPNCYILPLFVFLQPLLLVRTYHLFQKAIGFKQTTVPFFLNSSPSPLALLDTSVVIV